MLPDFVEIHERAFPALGFLSSAERAGVTAKFIALRHLPFEEWSREGVRQAKAPVYTLRVPPKLVVFFSVLPGDRFLIEDFVNKERLETYFSWPQEPVAQT